MIVDPGMLPPPGGRLSLLKALEQITDPRARRGIRHTGLAMSRRLTERSIDHVVLERGEVANSWRTQRWPGLRLLTPNWQTRLPGHGYAGGDPDGFIPVGEVVATLSRYARLIGAPVRTATLARAVRATPKGFQIQAND